MHQFIHRLIYPTDQRSNPAQFRKKILRIDGFEKRCFIELAILDFFFQKKKIVDKICPALTDTFMSLHGDLHSIGDPWT